MSFSRATNVLFQVQLEQAGKTVTLPVQSLNPEPEAATTFAKDQPESLASGPRAGKTSVCVRALYGPYNNAKQMGGCKHLLRYTAY